jgi:PAS domain-containing protein
MTIDIDMHFTRWNPAAARMDGVPEKEIKGYQFADFFADNGYKRAHEATTVAEARRILSQTYKGPDTEGIKLVWVVKEY